MHGTERRCALLVGQAVAARSPACPRRSQIYFRIESSGLRAQSPGARVEGGGFRNGFAMALSSALETLCRHSNKAIQPKKGGLANLAALEIMYSRAATDAFISLSPRPESPVSFRILAVSAVCPSNPVITCVAITLILTDDCNGMHLQSQMAAYILSSQRPHVQSRTRGTGGCGTRQPGEGQQQRALRGGDTHDLREDRNL